MHSNVLCSVCCFGSVSTAGAIRSRAQEARRGPYPQPTQTTAAASTAGTAAPTIPWRNLSSLMRVSTRGPATVIRGRDYSCAPMPLPSRCDFGELPARSDHSGATFFNPFLSCFILWRPATSPTVVADAVIVLVCVVLCLCVCVFVCLCVCVDVCVVLFCCARLLCGDILRHPTVITDPTSVHM